MRKQLFSSLAWSALLILTSLGVSSVATAQQTSPKEKPGPAKVVLEGWNEVGNKLVAMAEDWPADKYDYRPNDQVRTFAQQLLHAAASNYYATNTALGESTKTIDENPKFTTKEAAVAFLKKSVADGAAAIQKVGDAGVMDHLDYWVGLTEHMGEHYGQLVVYYRNNGVIPPASRKH